MQRPSECCVRRVKEKSLRSSAARWCRHEFILSTVMASGRAHVSCLVQFIIQFRWYFFRRSPQSIQRIRTQRWADAETFPSFFRSSNVVQTYLIIQSFVFHFANCINGSAFRIRGLPSCLYLGTISANDHGTAAHLNRIICHKIEKREKKKNVNSKKWTLKTNCWIEVSPFFSARRIHLLCLKLIQCNVVKFVIFHFRSIRPIFVQCARFRIPNLCGTEIGSAKIQKICWIVSISFVLLLLGIYRDWIRGASRIDYQHRSHCTRKSSIIRQYCACIRQTQQYP